MISMTQDRVPCRAFVNTESGVGFNKRNFLIRCTNTHVLWRKFCHELISQILVEPAG
jgi:hypothetical protein